MCACEPPASQVQEPVGQQVAHLQQATRPEFPITLLASQSEV
jgi:hypothetical protein